MVKDMHHKSSWPVNRTLLVLSSLLLLILLVLFAIKPLYDEYHDRPLAANMQYIGRDYNSGCILIFGCFGPTTETFYYATDSDPTEVLESLSGWRIESKTEGTHYTPDSVVDAIGYNLVSNNGKQANITYIPNKKEISQVSKLLPTSKEYILSVSHEDYDKLRDAEN